MTPGPGGLVPGVLDWEPVGPPWLRADRYLRSPVAWADGFAVLQERPTRDGEEFRAIAVWRSPDGRTWTRSRLPAGIIGARELLPLRGGLVLVTDDRGFRRFTVSFGFWRSPNGVDWRRAGGFDYRVPKRLERWRCQANHQHVATVDDRIMVYVSKCWDPCCGAAPLPIGSERVVGLAAQEERPADARGTRAWSSGNGSDWERVRLVGMAPPGTDDYGIAIRQTDDELLAVREGREPAVLRSSDGIAWTTFGQVPDRFDEDGQLGLVPIPDGVLLIGESYDIDDGTGYGNAMVIWRVTAASTTLTYVRQPAFVLSVVVDGAQVLVRGSSWGSRPIPGTLQEADEEWSWLIGSVDSGMTWDEGLAWTGSDGSCLGDMAARGTTVIALACIRRSRGDPPIPPGTPAFWIASLEGFPVPSPSVPD
ncbi:MAG: hypothetical protein KF809_09570 [Chloroflexi bacterium]|nr:hypothetical protein [Chloroflexota bacterium]